MLRFVLFILTNFIVGIPVFFLSLFAFSLITAIPVMFFYNFVIPQQFGLDPIDYLHAWALLILCTMLFKSAPVAQTVFNQAQQQYIQEKKEN